METICSEYPLCGSLTHTRQYNIDPVLVVLRRRELIFNFDGYCRNAVKCVIPTAFPPTIHENRVFSRLLSTLGVNYSLDFLVWKVKNITSCSICFACILLLVRLRFFYMFIGNLSLFWIAGRNRHFNTLWSALCLGWTANSVLNQVTYLSWDTGNIIYWIKQSSQRHLALFARSVLPGGPH